jgi:hypothetical protein
MMVTAHLFLRSAKPNQTKPNQTGGNSLNNLQCWNLQKHGRPRGNTPHGTFSCAPTVFVGSNGIPKPECFGEILGPLGGFQRIHLNWSHLIGSLHPRSILMRRSWIIVVVVVGSFRHCCFAFLLAVVRGGVLVDG